MSHQLSAKTTRKIPRDYACSLAKSVQKANRTINLPVHESTTSSPDSGFDDLELELLGLLFHRIRDGSFALVVQVGVPALTTVRAGRHPLGRGQSAVAQAVLVFVELAWRRLPAARHLALGGAGVEALDANGAEVRGGGRSGEDNVRVAGV